jgi:tRNA threonylcarbamoyladenosine biosynthesis protein TsaE
MESTSVEETGAFAELFLKNLVPNKIHATVVGLQGDLGSGKTTFVQAIAEALGVRDTVTSPTFVIMKRYALHDVRFTNMIHIDAYRLESGEELRVLGWDNISRDPHNLVLVEWPERVADVLPEGTDTIQFRFVDEHTRDIIF